MTHRGSGFEGVTEMQPVSQGSRAEGKGSRCPGSSWPPGPGTSVCQLRMSPAGWRVACRGPPGQEGAGALSWLCPRAHPQTPRWTTQKQGVFHSDIQGGSRGADCRLRVTGGTGATKARPRRTPPTLQAPSAPRGGEPARNTQVFRLGADPLLQVAHP